MFSPLTMVLKKIFVSGFYRMHSGLLIFLFITFISYCFFIKTLGHVPPEIVTYWNLIITLTIVTNPLMMVIFFIACLIYAFKSWQYVANQLREVSNEFLFMFLTN